MELGKNGKERGLLRDAIVMLFLAERSNSVLPVWAAQWGNRNPDLEVLTDSCRHAQTIHVPRSQGRERQATSTHFPVHCFLCYLPESFTRRKIPLSECESQTHHMKAVTAPQLPVLSLACWENTCFRETGSPEIAEAGNTWLAGADREVRSRARSIQHPDTPCAQQDLLLSIILCLFLTCHCAAHLVQDPGTNSCHALSHTRSGIPPGEHTQREAQPLAAALLHFLLLQV